MTTSAEPVSLWRRIVDWRTRGRRAESLQDPEVERRVWVRFPVSLETTCQQAKAENQERLSAKVRNISRGGINLEVDRPFEAGTLLSVELPGPGEKSSYKALAYVIHATPQNEDAWSLGCTFARELSDEDLEIFGAERKRTDRWDQRTWERFPCSVRGTYQLLSDAEQKHWPAQVLNISSSGVGLLVEQPIEIGTLMSVELQGKSGPTPCTILACVVHVTPREGEGLAIGCNFIRELTEQEMHALLSNQV